MPYARYAIYYTLPAGPLSEFGAAWLGWNLSTGERPDAPQVANLPAPAHDLSQTPRKYGFHGTIKPPFHLTEGETAKSLDIALAAFCAKTRAVQLDGLELARLGRFLALVPTGDTAPLKALAARVVEDFDHFRAALSDEELQRRRSRPLTAAQDALLEQWGYPYVMDEFRFHMTLTGQLPSSAAKHTQNALAPILAPLLPAPFHIDALTLCGEDHSGMFHSLARYKLA
ncbi:DUF1045 domain-containing protein [Primorskyibacter sp. 2E233]|uniref:DUF1045 domain-containing protein n=1 Tax=Primorskyibacter sp. 2E233 TaxID=3413431 RepID=UPI003BF0C760